MGAIESIGEIREKRKHDADRLRIALLAPIVTPIPPPSYAGTERVIAALAHGLHERGHEVTLYASGDSDVEYELVPVVPQSLWRSGYKGDGRQFAPITVAAAWRDAERFDVIHSHIDSAGFLFARHGPTPVVTTLHNRLDTDASLAMPRHAVNDGDRSCPGRQ